jgi:TldD protein
VSLLSEIDPSFLRRLAAGLVTRFGEYADLFLERTREATLVRRDDATCTVLLGGAEGGAARRIDASGTRHASVAGLQEDHLAALGRGLRADEATGLLDDAPRVGGEVDTLEPLDALRDYLDAVRAAISRATGADVSFQARAQVRVRSIAVATSEGEIVEEERAWVTFTARLSAARPVGSAPGFVVLDGGGGSDPNRLRNLHPPVDVGERMVRRLGEQGDTAPAPTGEMTVVLAPGPGGIFFHEACGHALEGDNAVHGRSPFSELIGDMVGPDDLTLVDDPTLPGLPGSCRVDDEGWPTERTVLIDSGRLVGLLLDRATALLAATSPTGSARRESYRELPLPRMSNTFVMEGRCPPGEILASVPRGLYIAELGAGEVDATRAEFAFNVRRGYLISGGRLVAPIAPAVVSGNGVRALSGIRMVGSDLRFDGGAGECGKDGQRARAAVGQPTIKVDGLTIRAVGAR